MTTLPAKMRACVYGPHGKPTVKDDTPLPKLSQGHVLVRVEAASLNPVDYKFYKLSGALAPLLWGGKDFAGTVAAANPGSAFHVGDRVVGVCRTGTLAEYCAAKEGEAAKLPAGVSAADACTLPVAGCTALQQLKDLKPGHSVAVPGASGGVGTFVVQIAKRALGASRVVAVCSGANSELVKSLGADEVVDYTRGDEAVAAALKANPVDVVADTVSSPDPVDKDYRAIARAALKPGGVHVAINGGATHFLAAMLHSTTGLQLQGRAYRVMLCQVNGPDLGTLAGWVADGKLRPVIAATFPLEQAAVEAAYGQLEGRRVKGKLVCAVAQPPPPAPAAAAAP